MSSATQIAHLDALLSRARNRVKAIATMGSSFLTEFVGALEPRLSRTRRFSRRCGRCGRCGPRVMRPARGVGKDARCFLASAAFAASFLACRKENSAHLDMLQPTRPFERRRHVAGYRTERLVGALEPQLISPARSAHRRFLRTSSDNALIKIPRTYRG